MAICNGFMAAIITPYIGYQDTWALGIGQALCELNLTYLMSQCGLECDVTVTNIYCNNLQALRGPLNDTN